MHTATSPRPSSTAYKPLALLAQALGRRLQASTAHSTVDFVKLPAQVAKALHQVLDAQTPLGSSARLQLIRHLVDIESQQANKAAEQAGQQIESPDSTTMLTTTQAAQLLGYSRPYVAMLIDQQQLAGATVTAGGHRRVPRAAVLAWQKKDSTTGRVPKLRSVGQKIGAYISTEAQAIARLKQLAKQQR